MTPPLPAFGICGWSGSGKTTLIEALIPRFRARGLRVAVVKHDVHGIHLDPAGKDSDRLFRAGAAVALLGPNEILCRVSPSEQEPLRELILSLDASYDLVLCEGHKSVRYERKVWLRSRPGEEPPADVPGIDRILEPGESRVRICEQLLEDWLDERLRRTTLCAGVLIGGASRRMGRPKHLLAANGKTWVEQIAKTLERRVSQVVLLGSGAVPDPLHHLPRLPDAEDKSGPLAGMLSAMRWRPDAAWLFVACDLPWLSVDAVDWLIAQRKPGVWAVLPRSGAAGLPEPLMAVYEPRIRRILETLDAPSRLRDMAPVRCPAVPRAIRAAWRDADTPAEAALLGPPTSEPGRGSRNRRRLVDKPG